MSQLPFYWIDAFTDSRFGGNPCAVVLDSDAMTPDQMQTLAREINLSETAFVRKSSLADFGARYFTPQEELPFAGHPTVASIHALIQAGRIQESRGSVQLELPAGIIPIKFELDACGTKVSMDQLAPRFLKTYDAQDIAPLFGLGVHDILTGAPIQTVSTGTPILMIPLTSLEALKRVRHVAAEKYLEMKSKSDFLFIHHFCLTGVTPSGRTFARSLPTPPSALEDPYTGSATGCMAAYLWKYGLIKESHFIAEQGHWLGRPGQGELTLIGSTDQINSIRLAGRAVTVMEGRLTL